ncbi:peptide ABC transporter substrate-binding protein [Paenibacillus selenitireducens]|uniref:Peptide ABC transporter substrate-binding protein n=1 Tax=Paenibacillus selenitireducens TaxID=1324314 RepID=A0A1T2X4A6_9BACL|nr:ABC transporter substrate-binding protein [Paenibacillus selenitireducens]OPA74724.1 peptide ABC transporter substrate-binding protein [Paenibacillus selenitireducens]
MKKSMWFTVLSFTLMIALLAGCAPKANQASNSDVHASSDAASSSTGGAITVAYSEGGQTLDPAEANDLTSDTLVLALYDQLVTYGVKQVNGADIADTTDIKPMLAESWEVASDNVTYTFKLRKDAKFQSGNPVTADDVVFSLEHIKNSNSGGFLYQQATIDSFRKVDDSTVEVKLTRPNQLFLQILAMYSFSVIDQKSVQGDAGDFLKTKTAGSGPFVLEKWDPSSEAILKANDAYWQDRAKLDKVTLKFMKEASTRTLLLGKGDLDLAMEIPPKDIETLKSNENITVRSDASNRILYMGLNTAVKPFDNEKVRQAMSYAMPTDALLKDVMFGQAKQMKSIVASNTPGFSDAGYVYSYNLDKAKELLAEAGYPNGFDFDFTLGSGFKDWEDSATILQAELKKIGVNMNIKKLARAQFLEQVQTKKVQAYFSKWTSFVNDPEYHLGFLANSASSSNYVNYNNPKVDDLLKKAAVETDSAKRNEMYGQIQEMINTDMPYAYLYEYNRIVAFNKDLKGYIFFPDECLRFYPLSK